MKSKKDLICAGAIAGVVLLSAAFLIGRHIIAKDQHIAYVYSHGQLVETIDLDKVEQPYYFTIGESEGDYNIVSVKPGSIEVKHATCPDQICVKTGTITNADRPIVCLPNELVIKIGGADGAGDSQIDAVAQ